MPKSRVRGELQTKFKELTSKYKTLVDYSVMANQPLEKVYQDMLDDLQSLEDICIYRGRY